MIVAGGVYLEVCVSPETIRLLGSGGRAALGLANLSSDLQLHAFHPASKADEVFPNFEPFGIDVQLYPASDRIAFKYLYPLARPRITPVPLPTAGSIAIEGRAVLRFGCLEGDFRVDASHAVYDPQSAVRPDPFGANGSRADHLAVVLNRAELRASTGIEDVDTAAIALMSRDHAEVVVVKSGPDGARVFAQGANAVDVPAFQANAIYKVGSGDVFSATFAHHWAEARRSPADAARLASLHTAEYVESQLLPVRNPPPERTAIRGSPQRCVTVAFESGGVSADWLRAEVLAGLTDLSLKVQPLQLSNWQSLFPVSGEPSSALLVVAQTPDMAIPALLTAARVAGLRVLIYVERLPAALRSQWESQGAVVEQDLTSALYSAAWS